MNWNIWGRAISIAAGAGVLFGLRQGLGYELSIAIPAGVCVYLVLRGVFAYLGSPPAQ